MRDAAARVVGSEKECSTPEGWPTSCSQTTGISNNVDSVKVFVDTRMLALQEERHFGLVG